MRVAVLNETLSLRTHDIICKIEDARSWWRPRNRRNGIVVLRWPADGCEVKTGVSRSAIVRETAEAGGHTDDSRWSNRIVISESSGITFIFFRATVGAETRSQRIDGQVKNIPVRVAEEDALFGAEIVVESPYDLVLISSAAGGRCLIVRDDPRGRIEGAGSIGRREVFQQS